MILNIDLEQCRNQSLTGSTTFKRLSFCVLGMGLLCTTACKYGLCYERFCGLTDPLTFVLVYFSHQVLAGMKFRKDNCQFAFCKFNVCLLWFSYRVRLSDFAFGRMHTQRIGFGGPEAFLIWFEVR